MLRRGLRPFLAFMGIWWMLAGKVVEVGIPAALAIGVGLLLYFLLGGGRGDRLRPAGLITFLPYFIRQSVRGGWDVSRRALSPGMPLNPELLRHDLTLPAGPPRIFLTNALSLLPGTFGADLDGDVLVVHLLVGGPGSEARVGELEARVARLFGVPGP
jgi:multicomponent Na+:H+ antiporter subunit E